MHLSQKRKSCPHLKKKWEEKGYCFTRNEWNLIYNLPFKCTQETRLQWLQTQLLHRISATNKYLCNCNLINSASCSFCGQLTETINHLFSECYLIKELWDKIKHWLKDLQLNVNFDNKSILFGKYLNSDIHLFENLLILIVKQYIYACKFSFSKQLNVEALKHTIINRPYVEKYILLKNCKYQEYNNYWSNIFQKLES